jgi:hypothetical protein
MPQSVKDKFSTVTQIYISAMRIAWERVRDLHGHLKRLLGMERRLTVQEFYQVLQLSETIINYGKMLQSYFQTPREHAMIDVPELAFRLRETPEAIEDALWLLKQTGRAEACDHGRWRLRLSETGEIDNSDVA